MNYITLTPEVFFDKKGKASIVLLSQYCQLPTTKKFIYDGTIYADHYDNLTFPNIVKANGIYIKDIANEFPDLEHAKTISYYAQGIPDIGKVNSADNFYMYLNVNEPSQYIKIIDNNTLIINGKELNIGNAWTINAITNLNYKELGF